MTHQDLRDALPITGGALTIDHDTLDSAFSGFLKTCYQGQPIAITGATFDDDESGDTDDGAAVVITGKSSFFHRADLPVIATIWSGDDGEIQALFEYQLIGDVPGPNPWRFSRSLPKLPTVWNYGKSFPLFPVHPEPGPQPPAEPQKPYIDSLMLSRARYAVSTHARRDPVTDVPLQPGINYVGRMKPGGAIGILEHTLRSGPAPLVLHGTIRIPRPTEVTRPLALFESIWSRPDAPGLHLQADLDLDFDIGKGKLSLDQTRFRVYSPHSTDWLDTHSTFAAKHGYAARLRIPSADITLDLGADLEWGLPRAKLFSRCDGITLGKLTQLADLAGGGGLSSVLPAPLKKAVAGLKKLELTYVSMNLTQGAGKPTVSGVAIEVGMPGVTWKVWKNDLMVSDIACRFEISQPFGGAAKRSVAVTVMGTVEIAGVAVDVKARSDKGFTLYAALASGETIPLGKLMKRYTPSVPVPASLTVDSLRLMLAPGRSYSMATTVSGKPRPWVIPVGRSKLTIGSLLFNFACSSGGKVTGTFAGSARYGKDLSLDVVYTIPGDIVIRSVIDDVTLSQLIGWLSSRKGSLPAGFDLRFATTSVLIQKKGSDYVFQVGAQVAEIGAFAFEVRKVAASGWGFAAGVALTRPLSELPGLGALKSFEKSFQLQKLLLTVSSFDAASFQFPDMAQFNTPGLASQGAIALPAQSAGLSAGMCVYAQWKINAKDKQQKMLRKFLGLPSSLDVTLQIGKNPSRQSKLFVGFTTKIQGNPLVCQFGAMMQNGEPALFLDGQMTVKINKKPVVFSLTMFLVSSGMFLSGTMAGTVKFGTVQLSNLALMTAVGWSGLPSLGIAATINVSSFSSSIAVLFDSTNPSKSLFAGAVSDLTLKDVATALAAGKKMPKGITDVLARFGVAGTQAFTIPGSVSTALDNLDLVEVSKAFQEAGVRIPSTSSTALLVVGKRGRSWQLTDLQNQMRHYQLVKKGQNIQVTVNAQIYCAPQTTSIGRLRFTQGFYLNGALDILGVRSSTTIEVNPNKGIAIDSHIDKAVVIYKPEFFALSDRTGKKGPRLSVSTFQQPRNKVADFRKPHFYLDGQVVLLGLKSLCFVQVTVSGAKFAIEQSSTVKLNAKAVTGSVERGFALRGQLGKNVLSAGGSISLALNGKMTLGKLKSGGKTVNLGTVKLDFLVKASADIGFTRNKAFADLSGEFRFQGEKFCFKTKLNVTAASLASVEKVVIAEVEKVFTNALKGPEKWAKWVKKGAVAGFKDAKQASKALKDVYRKSSKDVAKALKGAGWSSGDVGDALKEVYKLDEKDLKAALKGAGYASSTVDKYAASAYKGSSKAVSKAGKSAGKGVNKAGKAMGVGRKKKRRKKRK